MKTLLTVTILLTLVGCGTQSSPTPSQNGALNKISKSSAEKKRNGWMQRHMDSWLKNDWEKNTQGFEEKKSEEVLQTDSAEETRAKVPSKLQERQRSHVSKKKEQDSGFSLQHFVDKAAYYMNHEEKSTTPSHAKQLEKMPVIGK